MNDQQTAALGTKAASELEATSEAFEQLKAAMVEELIATPVGQDLKVLRLQLALQDLVGLKKALTAMVGNGQIARHALAANTTLLRPH